MWFSVFVSFFNSNSSISMSSKFILSMSWFMSSSIGSSLSIFDSSLSFNSVSWVLFELLSKFPNGMSSFSKAYPIFPSFSMLICPVKFLFSLISLYLRLPPFSIVFIVCTIMIIMLFVFNIY